jgi:hydrogenase maturation protease
MEILVIGLGQSLRGDDGAGLAAVRLWQEKYPRSAKQVRVELSELPGLNLLDMVAGADVALLVDAVLTTSPSGTLVRMELNDQSALDPSGDSAHDWGVVETLRLGRQLYPRLAMTRIVLIGISGGQFDLGAGLSPEIQYALEDAARMLEYELQALLSPRA